MNIVNWSWTKEQRWYLLQLCAGTTEYPLSRKNEFIHRSTSFTKVNSKWIINLKLKCRSLKLPEYDIKENWGDLKYGNEFLDKIPKTQSMREETGKLNFINIQTK